MFSYQYHSLYGDEIRLLRCIPDHKSGGFTFTLTRHSLRHPPKYYALSYTWDDPLGKECDGTSTLVDYASNQQPSAEAYHKHRPSESHRDGEAAFARRGSESAPEFGKFMIRPNLMAALQTLNQIYPEVYLWVDAICINQTDVSERNYQIPRMYRIYEKAIRVIAWLGPEADDSDIALDFIRNVASRADEPQLHHWLARTVDDRAYATEWRAVCALYSRKWWSRVWIIQETTAANIVEIFCGTSTLRWSHLCEFDATVRLAWTELAIRLDLRRFQGFRKGHNAIILLEQFRNDSLRKETVTLLEMLRMTSESDGTDPRDRLYAILGLAYDGNDLVPEVNYSQSTQEVFGSMTVNYIKMHSALDMISLAGCAPLLERESSWIPDLSRSADFQPNLNHGLVFMLRNRAEFTFDACRHRFAEAYFPQALAVLRCKGMYVDEVDGLGYSHYGSENEMGSIKARYQMSRYGSSRRVAEAIWRTFVTDRNYGTAYMEKAPRDFVNLFLSKWADAEHYLGPDRSQKEGDYRHDRISDFEMSCQDNRWFEIAGKPIRQWVPYLARQAQEIPRNKGVPPEWLEKSVNQAQYRHRLCTTNTGYLGMVPYWTRPGDMICVLFGHTVPVLLRQVGRQYRYVGDCYVHGIMHGEAVDQLDRGELRSEWFDIV